MQILVAEECGRSVRGLDSWLELNSGFKEIKQAQRKCKFWLPKECGCDVRGLGFGAQYERKFNLVRTRALKQFK